MEGEKRLKREEEIVEIALAAAATALFVSGLKKLLPCVLHQWPLALLVAPPPFLLLLLNLIIASIVVISIQPNLGRRRGRKTKKKSGGRGSKSSSYAASVGVREEEEKQKGCFEPQEEGDAEELNARAEAFIMAFRRQLRLDSFSSGVRRTKGFVFSPSRSLVASGYISSSGGHGEDDHAQELRWRGVRGR
ncbi:unnamed protein product [Musa acuminata subsp. burmannicoides]